MMSDTPNYDRLIRAHAETGQRPMLTRSLDALNGTDRGWSIKFVCGRRGTKNRWEYVSGSTIEDAACKALDMRAKRGYLAAPASGGIIDPETILSLGQFSCIPESER